MSSQKSDFSIGRGLGLSVGFAFLLSNTSAIASPGSLLPAFSVAQSDSSSQPVVVDTESGTTTPTTNGSGDPVTASGTRFSCENMNGQYTVMYQPESQPNKSFPWATPSALGGGWNSQRRCNEISRRLESYRPDGLVELRTEVKNNYNTICVTTQNDSSCRIVLTVPPGQDPTSTRDRVFQNLTTADSGQQTDSVYTFADSGRSTNAVDRLYNWGRSVLSGGRNRQAASSSINLRPFLDKADGGTGTRLVGGVSTHSKSKLNPGSFR